MNNLNNLPPFYIGQKVVYITGKIMPKDSIHIVSDIKREDCGCWVISINGYKLHSSLPPKPYKCFTCDSCGGIMLETWTSNDGFDGWNPNSFRAIQEQSFPLLTYSKVLEEVAVSAN
jgi:hypothetical protein